LGAYRDVVAPPGLLTTAQLSKRLGISVRTLQRWRVDGWITPDLVTVGGQARWDEEHVREQLRELAERQQGQSED
jgi:predicted site-specific integrase-resolvase